MGKKEEIKLKVLDSDKGKEKEEASSEELSTYGSQDLEQGESEEHRSQDLELDPGCSSRISGYIEDPFPTISDKTIQRTGDIYLPIPGATLSLGASIAFAAKAPPLMSGIFTLFGATATIGGKVVSGMSDRRMLKQPMKAARETGVDEAELLPKGYRESSAYYANLVNLGATIISVAGIIVGGLFLFGVIFNNDTNNDTHSSGGDTSTFSNKEMLGILLNAVTFLDNFLKVLKGYEVKYRERITQLTKEHEKQVKEEKIWLPGIKERREKIRLLVEKLKLIINEQDEGESYNESNELLLECKSFLNHMADKKFNLFAKKLVSEELQSQPDFLDLLTKSENELNAIALKVYDSFTEDQGEQRNKVMRLLEKIGKRSNLDKLEPIDECLKFLTSEIDEQANFSPVEEAQSRNTLTKVEERLATIKVQLTNTIEQVLDKMQNGVMIHNMPNLSGIMSKLDDQKSESRSSGSNFSKK